MLVRKGLAIGVIAATWLGLACSSTPPRDINYGTDVGADFTPPDVGAPKDVQVEESGNSVDSGGDEVALDASPDAAASDLDSSIGGSE